MMGMGMMGMPPGMMGMAPAPGMMGGPSGPGMGPGMMGPPMPPDRGTFLIHHTDVCMPAVTLKMPSLSSMTALQPSLALHRLAYIAMAHQHQPMEIDITSRHV